MENICPSCGAENLESARYCRKCGVRIGSEEFHEAPTRSFEEQRVVGVETVGRSDPGTAPQGRVVATDEAPRYVPPQQAPGGALGYSDARFSQPMDPRAYTTGPLKKGPNWLLIGGLLLGMIFLIALVALPVMYLFIKPSHTTAGEKGAPVAIPSEPTKPPRTPSPGLGSGKVPDAMQEWIYPDSNIVNFTQLPIPGMQGPNGVIEMQSDDDPDDIFEYYEELMTDSASSSPNIHRTSDKDVLISGSRIVEITTEKGVAIIKVVIAPGGEDMGFPDGDEDGPGSTPSAPPTPPTPPAAPPAPPKSR